MGRQTAGARPFTRLDLSRPGRFVTIDRLIPLTRPRIRGVSGKNCQITVATHVGVDSEELTLEGANSVQIKISARHGHLSDETQAKINEKLEKLPRYYDRLSSIDATVDLEHRDAPNVDLRVSADHKHDFVAVCHSTELMAAVDEVVEKMETAVAQIQDQNSRPPPCRRTSPGGRDLAPGKFRGPGSPGGHGERLITDSAYSVGNRREIGA